MLFVYYILYCMDIFHLFHCYATFPNAIVHIDQYDYASIKYQHVSIEPIIAGFNQVFHLVKLCSMVHEDYNLW